MRAAPHPTASRAVPGTAPRGPQPVAAPLSVAQARPPGRWAEPPGRGLRFSGEAAGCRGPGVRRRPGGAGLGGGAQPRLLSRAGQRRHPRRRDSGHFSDQRRQLQGPWGPQRLQVSGPPGPRRHPAPRTGVGVLRSGLAAPCPPSSQPQTFWGLQTFSWGLRHPRARRLGPGWRGSVWTLLVGPRPASAPSAGTS